MRQHLFLVGILLLTGVMLACGGPWRDGYFKKGVDRLTQDEVTEKLGPPHTAKTPALGGDSVWTYRVPISDRELASVSFAQLGDTVKDASALMGKATEQGRQGHVVLLPLYPGLQRTKDPERVET